MVVPSEMYSSPYLRVKTLVKLLQYKQWADHLVFDALRSLPEEEILKKRMTTFGNIIRTVNHAYVVDDIFKHHLLGEVHSYRTRNTDQTPSIDEMSSLVAKMNDWYLGYVSSWTDEELDETIHFKFLNGQNAAMTREEIVLHIVNHATYHRGFVGDMLKQIPHDWPSNDLTVFLCREGSA